MASVPNPIFWVETLLSNHICRDQAAVKYFRIFDSNGNGVLEWSASCKLISALSDSLSIDSPDQEKLRQVFQMCDKNRDGALSEAEFQQFFHVVLKSVQAHIEKAELSISIVGISGEQLWGPTDVKSSMLIAALRRLLATALDLEQYKIVLLKGNEPLHWKHSLTREGIVDGDVLCAVLGLTRLAATCVIDQIAAQDPEVVKARDKVSEQELVEWIRGLCHDLGIDDDADEQWRSDIRPWLEAWFMTGFALPFLACQWDAADLEPRNGLLQVERAGCNDMALIRVFDISGQLSLLAPTSDASDPRGAMWLIEVLDDEWPDGQNELSLDVLFQMNLAPDRFARVSESMTDFFTGWALTGKMDPSDADRTNYACKRFQYVL